MEVKANLRVKNLLTHLIYSVGSLLWICGIKAL